LADKIDCDLLFPNEAIRCQDNRTDEQTAQKQELGAGAQIFKHKSAPHALSEQNCRRY
jgi:hypothetical protein